MDVQSAVITNTDPSSAGSSLANLAPISPPPTPAADPNVAGSSSGTAAPGALPASATGQATLAGDAHSLAKHDPKLSDAVGKLFGAGGEVQVSYKVEKPNEIVTVFTDASTGAVIAQFPSEMMVRMAQFFQQLAGGMLDKSV